MEDGESTYGDKWPPLVHSVSSTGCLPGCLAECL